MTSARWSSTPSATPCGSSPRTILPNRQLTFNRSVIRAFEVGYGPASPKYELHIKLRTLRDGAVVRNRLLLPHPVRTSLRVCVICPDDSDTAKQALEAGAAVAGSESVFESIKAGKIEFDRCVAHPDAVAEMQRAGVARILGPKRLMPSVKDRTVTKDVVRLVKDLVSSAEYRERRGVVRLAVGQLGFSPEEMRRNIKAVTDSVKRDIQQLGDRITKEIHEIVLSSTHGPGLSLSGEYRSRAGVSPEELIELDSVE
jgi:large subunit ribosomal protein L1